MHSIEELIRQLNLQPHPEGGYYAETYRSAEMMEALPDRFSGPRAFSTAIYFLVPGGNFSGFHRIQADEGWHFYAGQPLRVYMLTASGEFSHQDLGTDLAQGQTFQFVVPHGVWFASEPISAEGYSLVGCTVAPGFDFADFEMGKADELAALCPQHADTIRRLCRE